MRYLIEKSNYYNEGDIVLIEYWYNSMLTPVEILKKEGRKYVVSHNNHYSEIKNAPDEKLFSYQIIDKLNIN